MRAPASIKARGAAHHHHIDKRLAAAGVYLEIHIRVFHFSLDDFRGDHEIAIAPVARRAENDLLDLYVAQIRRPLDIVRIRRAGDHGLDAVQVDFRHLVPLRVRAGWKVLSSRFRGCCAQDIPW